MKQAKSRLLLVENDPESAASVLLDLTRRGYRVEAHPDYRGALAVVEGPAQLDLMITALRLPAGTPHGIALANMAQQKRPGLRVIFIAATEEEASWVDPRWSAFVLRRPVEPQALADMIGRALSH